MSKFQKLLALGALASLAGCYNVTYISKTRTPAAAIQDEKLNFFIFGIVGERDVDAGKICPNGVAKVHTQNTFVDMLLTVVTIGIYAPRTVHVTCAQ